MDGIGVDSWADALIKWEFIGSAISILFLSSVPLIDNSLIV